MSRLDLDADAPVTREQALRALKKAERELFAGKITEADFRALQDAADSILHPLDLSMPPSRGLILSGRSGSSCH